MAKTIDHVFHSDEHPNGRLFQLASGYISQTTILFEKEQVIAVIEAGGNVAFFDTNDQPIAAGAAAPMDSGRQVYEDVRCLATADEIQLQFPIYTWIDHYPNCDGENDRWTANIVGYQTMILDRRTGAIR